MKSIALSRSGDTYTNNTGDPLRVVVDGTPTIVADAGTFTCADSADLTIGPDPSTAYPTSPWTDHGTIADGDTISLAAAALVVWEPGDYEGTYTDGSAENHTLSAASKRAAVASGDIDTPSVPGAGPFTITSLSRDAFSTAGGTSVTVTGTGFDGTASVSFVPTGGGTAVAATSTTFVSGTELTVVMPALSAGMWDCVVSQAGESDITLTGVLPDYPGGTYTLGAGGAIEILPAPTTTYVSHDFEDGTFGSFLTGSRWDSTPQDGIAVDNWGAGYAVSGTLSVRAQVPSNKTGLGSLEFTHTGEPSQDPTGVYQRWYLRTDQETIDALSDPSVGQIKLQLDRSGSNPPSWLMLGWGPAISGAGEGDQLGVVLDNGILLPPNNSLFSPTGNSKQSGYYFVAEEWLEIQTWFHRDTAQSVGRAKLWLNGKLYYDFESSAMGTDSGAGDQVWVFGIAYTQSTPAGSTLTIYMDDAAAADGFLEPV